MANVMNPRLLLCFAGSSSQAGAAPHRLDRGIAVDAKLRHEVVEHAEEANVVVEAVLDKVVEPVGTVGSPLAVDLDDGTPPCWYRSSPYTCLALSQ